MSRASERLRALDSLGYRDRVGTVIAFVDALPELAAVVEAAERGQDALEISPTDGIITVRWWEHHARPAIDALRASLDALREKLA